MYPSWRRQWQPTPVLLPGKSHGRRSLVGYSPWGLEESDRTARLHFHFSLSSIGEGNGNALLCSCLENPRDGGAWWDAIRLSQPLSSPSPPAFNLSQHQGLFQLVSSLNHVANFSFSISPSNEYSGLIYFRTDWFDLLAVQGTLKSLLQQSYFFISAISM